jgi:hypothetical protein
VRDAVRQWSIDRSSAADSVTDCSEAGVRFGMRIRGDATFLVLCLCTATVAGAQVRRFYVDVSVSGTALVGNAPFKGEYYDPTTSGLALVSFGHQPDVTRRLVAALHAGFFLSAVGGSTAQCRPTPLGGCLQNFPMSGIIALTVGGRPLTSRWRFVELTAGPAVVGQYTGGNTLGALAVARVGTPPGTYLSPGVAIQAIVAPIRGALIGTIGFGLSLRTW